MGHDRSISRQYEWRRRVIIETLRAREEAAVARGELPALSSWFHTQRAAVDAALDGCCICELLGGGRRLVVGFVHGWTYLGLPDGAACARSAIELCFLFFLEGSVVPAACSSGWHGYVGPILKYVGSRIGLTYPSYIPLPAGTAARRFWPCPGEPANAIVARQPLKSGPQTPSTRGSEPVDSAKPAQADKGSPETRAARE